MVVPRIISERKLPLEIGCALCNNASSGVLTSEVELDTQTEKRANVDFRLAILSLAMGILSCLTIIGAFTGFDLLKYLIFLLLSVIDYLIFLGLPAVIIGVLALRRITYNKVGKVFAITGIVLGILSTILLIFLFLLGAAGAA